MMLLVSLYELFRRNFYSKIHDPVTVIAENDLDQVFADIMHIALNSRENDLAASGRIRFFHELLKVVYGSLHSLGGLENFGNDQLIVVEQAPDFGHTGHERAIDDVERRNTFFQLEVNVRNKAVFGAFDDVVGETLVERKVSRFFLFPFR